MRRVTRKIPRAALSFPALTAQVKTAAFTKSAKLMAAVSRVLLFISTCKKSGNGVEPAFQK